LRESAVKFDENLKGLALAAIAFLVFASSSILAVAFQDSQPPGGQPPTIPPVEGPPDEGKSVKTIQEKTTPPPKKEKSGTTVVELAAGDLAACIRNDLSALHSVLTNPKKSITKDISCDALKALASVLDGTADDPGYADLFGKICEPGKRDDLDNSQFRANFKNRIKEDYLFTAHCEVRAADKDKVAGLLADWIIERVKMQFPENDHQEETACKHEKNLESVARKVKDEIKRRPC
jgi:hypothetical protein